MAIIKSDSGSEEEHGIDVKSVGPESTSTNAWAALNSTNSQQFFEGWLQLQFGFIPNCFSAILALKGMSSNGPSEGVFSPVAVWPDNTIEFPALSELIDNVIERNEGLVVKLEDSSVDNSYGIAYPIIIDDQNEGVIAIGLNASNQSAIEFAMQQLQWGISWMQIGKLRASSRESVALNRRMSASIDAFSAVVAEADYNTSAMRFISQLSMTLDCERVSLGLHAKGKIKLQFLSDNAQFGERMNLVRSIEAAMTEADDQHLTVSYPPILSTNENGVVNVKSSNSDTAIHLAHESLAKSFDATHAVSIPLYHDFSCVAVLTLERAKDNPFTVDDCEFAESLAALVIHILEIKRLNDRSLIKKIASSGKQFLDGLVGSGNLLVKFSSVSFLIFALFIIFAEGDYQLSSDARLAATTQHIISAPFDGYIKSSTVKAGDTVKSGNVLVELDDRDLRLEKLKYIGLKSKLSRQYQEAIASYERARIKILDAEIAQADAELSLLTAKLNRAKLIAPFSGLVLSGDLSQRFGGALTKGEVLFELSPNDSYKVILLVRESRIADVQLGQNGTLFLSALPAAPLKFTVNQLTPVVESVDGGSFFLVEGSVQSSGINLHPGMEGVGKIYIGQRKYRTIWGRGFNEWLRLKLWSLF